MNEKTALILHGWPEYRLHKHFLTRYLRKNGYTVLLPNMFIREYTFSPQNVLNKVKEIKGDREIDVIVGVSLGGLMAPFVAKEFPESKLIFIASGAKLNTNVATFNIALKLANNTFVRKVILPLFLSLPIKLLMLIYELINPFTGDKSKYIKYKKDAVKNIKYIKSIPIEEEKEILEFIKTVDNSEILKSLNNEAIIFSGENDLLMGVKEGRKLNRLLRNSKLYISQGSHFDSFTKNDLVVIDSF